MGARAANPNKPIWVAWTLAEEPGSGLRSNEPIADAVARVEPLGVAAYLFNCTTPAAISAGLQQLQVLTATPVGAYPNRLFIPPGWTLDNDVPSGRSEMSVDEYLAFTAEWRRMGATIIGGCCGIGPEFIQGLSESVG